MVHSLFAAAMKPAIHPVTTSPCAIKNNMKKEDGGKVEDSSLSSDQLVPDYAARLVIVQYSLWDRKHHLYVSCFFDISPAFYLTFSCFICFFFFCFAWPTGWDQECIRWKTTDTFFAIWQLWVTVSRFYPIKLLRSSHLFAEKTDRSPDCSLILENGFY